MYVNTTTGWQVYDNNQPGYFGSDWSYSGGYAGYWTRGESQVLPSNVTIVGYDTLHTADMWTGTLAASSV